MTTKIVMTPAQRVEVGAVVELASGPIVKVLARDRREVDGQDYMIFAMSDLDNEDISLRYWEPSFPLQVQTDLPPCSGSGCGAAATYRLTDVDGQWKDKFLCDRHAAQNIGNRWNLLVIT